MTQKLLLAGAMLCTMAAAATAQTRDSVWAVGSSQNEYAYAMQPASDGGFIVVGTKGGTSGSSVDYWLARFDAQGNKKWEGTYGRPGVGETVWGLEPSLDGGWLVAGFSGRQFSGDEHALMYKIDDNGKVVWEKDIDYASSDHAHIVLDRPEGGYYMTGHTDSKGDPSGDVWMIRMDAERNILWEKLFSLNYGEHSHAARLTSDGGCVVLCHTVVNNLEKYWVFKVDSNGVQQWSKTPTSGNTMHDSPYYIVNTREGGFALFGGSSNNNGGTGWMLVLDSAGNTIVDKHYGGSTEDSFLWSGRQTSDGGFVGFGLTSGQTNGAYDAYVVKTDVKGEIEWEQRLGAEGNDYGYCGYETPDGFVVAGATLSNSLLVGGGQDMLLGKIFRDGGPVSSVEEDALATEGLSVFPNPVSGDLTIRLRQPNSLHGEILDAVGRTVATLTNDLADDGSARMSTANLPAGIYFVRIATTTGVATKAVQVIR
ncbi:MAG: T9SS type A sorting domain-containing protein [Chlorobi bacterium]|nr:MAG: PKD repeat protein [Chlorobi bacterium OLB7]MBK8909984.1 T9SS type A sorting domain-containing protein [Chlorobiota bacterium]